MVPGDAIINIEKENMLLHNSHSPPNNMCHNAILVPVNCARVKSNESS